MTDILLTRWHIYGTIASIMKVALVRPSRTVTHRLEAKGHDVYPVKITGRASAARRNFQVVVVGHPRDASPKDWVNVLARVKTTFPNTPWVFASDRLTARLATEATEAGAFVTTLQGVTDTLATIERLLTGATVRNSAGGGGDMPQQRGEPVVPPDPAFVGYIVPEFHDPKGRIDAERVAKTFGLAMSALAKPAGVTPSALSRRPTAGAAQRGLRELEFVWAVLRRELGSEDLARAWLYAAHPLLDGDAPIALLTKGSTTALADFVRRALAGQPT